MNKLLQSYETASFIYIVLGAGLLFLSMSCHIESAKDAHTPLVEIAGHIG